MAHGGERGLAGGGQNTSLLSASAAWRAVSAQPRKQRKKREFKIPVLATNVSPAHTCPGFVPLCWERQIRVTSARGDFAG